MDRLSSALRETEKAILVADGPSKKKLQAKYLRIFAALEARRRNDELTDEELNDWTTEEYERNEIPENHFGGHCASCGEIGP